MILQKVNQAGCFEYVDKVKLELPGVGLVSHVLSSKEDYSSFGLTIKFTKFSTGVLSQPACSYWWAKLFWKVQLYQ